MKTIKEIEDLGAFLEEGFSISDCCFQSVDFSKIEISWESLQFDNCIFLGCKLSSEAIKILNKSGCLIFPIVSGLPYEVFRSSLYSWQELFAESEKGGYNTKDEEIYYHFVNNKYNGNISEHLFQRIHDHSIDDGLNDLLRPKGNGEYEKRCIAIMGGHGIKRNNKYYKSVAKIAYLLSRHGYFIASGGGPGIMEAANLGAYMSAYGYTDLISALDLIDGSLHYSDPAYHHHALRVLKKYPKGNENLAIPTWFYGHEPSNIFASHIAKYFSNSIREDVLLAIALNGIVFAPGSAGTNQEIFMDAAQNHYGTFAYYSPMVFMGKKHYEEDTGIYPLLKHLSKDRTYGELLFISDSENEIVDYLKAHQPIRKIT